MTTLFRRRLTLFMSTLKYTTSFQRWFDIVPRRDVASTKRQSWDNVEMFAWFIIFKNYYIHQFTYNIVGRYMLFLTK